MKVTLLGTGTSGGVPSLGCNCKVCRSTDPRDRHLRSAALLETSSTRVLIDCGPDIREQLLPFPFGRIDAVLLTHCHYDHIAGLDDLRPFCVFGAINIYADNATSECVKRIMPYCFGDNLYPGVPLINLHVIKPGDTFRIGDISVQPIKVMHGEMPILGYRFSDFAYITDMKTIDDSELGKLIGVKKLVVNALRFSKEHHSHQLVKDAVNFANKIKAEEVFLTHVCHHIGLYAEASAMLPAGVYLAYDGMTINVSSF